MKKILTSFLILLQLGGGFMGLAKIINPFIYERSYSSSILATIVGIIFYTLGIIAGFSIIHKSKCARVLSIIYQSLQIPFINISALYYGFYSGFTASVLFQKEEVGSFIQIGSGIDIVLQPDSYFTLGINLVALALTVILIKKPNQWLELT